MSISGTGYGVQYAGEYRLKELFMPFVIVDIELLKVIIIFRIT